MRSSRSNSRVSSSGRSSHSNRSRSAAIGRYVIGFFTPARMKVSRSSGRFGAGTYGLMSTISDRWVAWKSTSSTPISERTDEFAPSHPTT